MIHRFTFVQSSVLDSCEYDDATKELTIRFQNGRTYTYVDVDKSVYEDLINAQSAGKHFSSIKKELKLKA